ncbi:MAG: hypothetical protein NZM04_05420 [Methylacidiphilales bacterium]|nr:hypothetical protein [Candidatus Methylacidiphilales bacterium]
MGWESAKIRSPAHLTLLATDCALSTQIAPDASEAVAIQIHLDGLALDSRQVADWVGLRGEMTIACLAQVALANAVILASFDHRLVYIYLGDLYIKFIY